MPLLLKTSAVVLFIFLGCLIALSTNQPFDCDDLHCWDGIIPGETTMKEAKMILEHLHTPENVAIYPNGIVWTHLGEERIRGFLPMSESDVVNEVQIFYQYPRPTITDLISMVGEPTRVYLIGIPDCDGIYVYFENHDILIWFVAQQDVGNVRPDQRIDVMLLLSEEQVTDTVFEWQGYINYCDLLWQ